MKLLDSLNFLQLFFLSCSILACNSEKYFLISSQPSNAFSDGAHFEELFVRELPTGKVLTHFQFTTRLNIEQNNDSRDFVHFDLLPKSLGHIIKKFHVEELHLTFTQGRWWNEMWGYPVIDAPVGVELWTWFQPPEETPPEFLPSSINALWKGLTFSLAGLFCASMEEMKNSVTTQPHLSFLPEGAHNVHKDFQDRMNNDLLRYSVLPRETVCTENLTPWIKLLPCKAKEGLGSLLNALKLYDVHFHSMGIHVRTIYQEKSNDKNSFHKEEVLELSQTFTAVFDPKQRASSNLIEWSFQTLFGRSSIGFCPLAYRSLIYLQPPSTWMVDDTDNNKPTYRPATDWNVIANPSSILLKTTSFQQNDTNDIMTPYSLIPVGDDIHNILIYDLQALNKMHSGFSLSVTSTTNLSKESYGDNENSMQSPMTPVSYQRYFTGIGQEYGGIAVHIQNNERNTPLDITYFEMTPWYLRIYYHTFKLYLSSTTTNRTRTSLNLFPNLDSHSVLPEEGLSSLRIVPAEPRASPGILEFSLQIPPQCSLSFSIQFEKAFLHWTEYPPDANRGFNIGPAVITVCSSPTGFHRNGSDELHRNGNRNGNAIGVSQRKPAVATFTGLEWSPLLYGVSSATNHSYRIYTEGLLVSLPTPDFSEWKKNP